MRGNRIQDIVSGQPLAVRPVPRQKSKPTAANQLRLQGWLTSPQSKSPLAPAADRSFVVVRSGKRRQADMSRLSKRFKA